MTTCSVVVAAGVALGLGAGGLGAAVPSPTSSVEPPQGNVFQQDLAWSPDGRWIAFSEYKDGGEHGPGHWSIHVVRADGSQGRQIVDNARCVSWAPDGSRLAFGSSRDGDWDIYSINADGSGIVRLTDDPAKDRQPAWSPKGDRIAFTSDRDGNEEIYVMGADGTSVARVTQHPGKDLNPMWSPDGSGLVFYREKGDGMDQVFTIAPDGTRETRITHDERNNVFPCFLPDGRIAYHSSAKGEKERLISTRADGATSREVETPMRTFFARWSPDGRQIALIGGRWPASAVYLMAADGTGLRKIVN